MVSRSLGFAVIALTIGIGDASPATDPPAAQTEQTRQVTVVHEMASVGAQVRAEARFFHGFVSRIPAGKGVTPVVLEIVDAANGRTTVHLLQKPKEIVVVGSKIGR
jgi:hypothetical protein